MGLTDIENDGIPHLKNFTDRLNALLNPQNIYVYMYEQWQGAGLAGNGSISSIFPVAAARAGHIHFNLEGIPNPNNLAEVQGSKGFRPGKITAAELYTIKHDATLCAKTSFYEEGGITPSISIKIDICGSQK